MLKVMTAGRLFTWGRRSSHVSEDGVKAAQAIGLAFFGGMDCWLCGVTAPDSAMLFLVETSQGFPPEDLS